MSKRWTLNMADVKRVARNALIFLAPVAIVELEILQRGGSTQELLIAVQVWGIGVLLDTFRKLQAGK